MYETFVGVGSNQKPAHHITEAIRLLERGATITGISTFYETPALGRPDAPPFYNGVVALRTPLQPQPLRTCVLSPVEKALGRKRDEPHVCTMDLDLLVHPGPWPPHPDIRERAFVAIPLLELAGDLELPAWGTRLSHLAARFTHAELTPRIQFTQGLRRRFLKKPAKRALAFVAKTP